MTAIFGRPGVPAVCHCHGAMNNSDLFVANLKDQYCEINAQAETAPAQRDLEEDLRAITDYMLDFIPTTWDSRHAGLDRLHAVSTGLERLQHLVFVKYGDT